MKINKLISIFFAVVASSAMAGDYKSGTCAGYLEESVALSSDLLERVDRASQLYKEQGNVVDAYASKLHECRALNAKFAGTQALAEVYEDNLILQFKAMKKARGLSAAELQSILDYIIKNEGNNG